MTINNIIEIIVLIVASGMCTLGAVLLIQIRKGLNDRIDDIKSNTNDSSLNEIIDIATCCVDIVIESLNQTIVDGIKEASEDGKLSIEDIKNIKNIAVTDVLDILSDSVKESLTSVYGDLTLYIEHLIEARIHSMKNAEIEKLLSRFPIGEDDELSLDD